jgi:hypothetical protein
MYFKEIYSLVKESKAKKDLYKFVLFSPSLPMILYDSELRVLPQVDSSLEEAYFIIPLSAEINQNFIVFLEELLSQEIAKLPGSMYVVNFNQAILFPSKIRERNQPDSVPMTILINMFIENNCSIRELPTVKDVTRVSPQTKRDFFLSFMDDSKPSDPSSRCFFNKWDIVVCVMYEENISFRGETFQLTRYVKFSRPPDKPFEVSMYRVIIDKGEAGSLNIGLMFDKDEPTFIQGDGLYNLLEAPEMRGIAIEIICYILKRMKNEAPWEDHGCFTEPTVFIIRAFGGGPASRSKEATGKSVRKLTRYYEKWGFLRSELSLYPNSLIKLNILPTQRSFALKLKDNDQYRDVVIIYSVRPQTISEFKRLVEED